MGSSLTVTGEFWHPSSTILIELHQSPPLMLLTFALAGETGFARTVTIPSNASTGETAIWVTGSSSEGTHTVKLPIFVCAETTPAPPPVVPAPDLPDLGPEAGPLPLPEPRPVAGPASGGLAETGGNFGGPALLAMLMALLGGAVLRRSRRPDQAR